MLDPGTNFSQAKNHAYSVNPVIDNYSTKNYKFGARRTAQNHASHRIWNSTADFGAGKGPQNRRNCTRSLSPSSRTEAIVRGQKELMEMVSKMPEGCYELTLKDIVEQSMVDQIHDLGVKQETCSKERSNNNITVDEEKMKKNEKKVRVSRSKSMDNGGFLLKMVFPPVSWNSRNHNSNGSKKNKSKKIQKDDLSAMNNSGRVSSKALLFDVCGGVNGGENEWLKNRFEEKEESCEGGGFSSNGGSSKSSGSRSKNNNGRQVADGCWSVIFRKVGKTAEF